MLAVHYYPVSPELHTHFATIHRGDLQAGVVDTIPAILGQLWLTDGSLHIRLPGAREPQPLPRVALLGFTSGSFQVASANSTALYGIGLWPLGWAQIVRSPAVDMADQVCDATELWPELAAMWTGSTERLLEEADGSRELNAVARWLHGRSMPTSQADTIHAIDRWLQGNDDVDDLAVELGVGRRQLQRITLSTHGGAPRHIANKWRVLRAAATMHLLPEESEKLWDGFSDQSHFIREFRRFTGITPGQYRGKESLTRRVLADEWHLASDHPLALASRKRE